MLKTNLGIFGAAIAALMVCAAPAGAVTFGTPSGSSTVDGAVNATADFVLGTNSLTITLTDLLSNPTSDGQLLSGISFSIVGAVGSPTLTSSTGPLSVINTASNTYSNAVVTSPLTHWGIVGGSLTALTGGQPNSLIIGPDSAGGFAHAGVYNQANNSISNHNPMVLGSATFVISLAGVNPLSTINSVVFQFGTEAGSRLVTAVCEIGCGGNTSLSETPLPATLPLFASGLGALGLAAWRKKRKAVKA